MRSVCLKLRKQEKTVKEAHFAFNLAGGQISHASHPHPHHGEPVGTTAARGTTAFVGSSTLTPSRSSVLFTGKRVVATKRVMIMIMVMTEISAARGSIGGAWMVARRAMHLSFRLPIAGA